MLLSRSRLADLSQPVPLACLRHAASVHPGPGSNPQIVTSLITLLVKTSRARLYTSSHISNVKVLIKKPPRWTVALGLTAHLVYRLTSCAKALYPDGQYYSSFIFNN